MKSQRLTNFGANAEQILKENKEHNQGYVKERTHSKNQRSGPPADSIHFMRGYMQANGVDDCVLSIVHCPKGKKRTVNIKKIRHRLRMDLKQQRMKIAT